MQADAPINTNLSVSMCELLSSTVLTIYEDVTAGRSRGDVVVSRRFAPYVLRNETGIVLRYGAAEQGEPGKKKRKGGLKQSIQQPLIGEGV